VTLYQPHNGSSSCLLSRLAEVFIQLYLDQLRVDQGRLPLSGVEGAGRGIQRWEDLRAYTAIDNDKKLHALGITGRWYNAGFPEDVTKSSEMSMHWSHDGKLIQPMALKKQAMELAVVCAESGFCKGLGRLTTAFCLQYVDFLNAKRKGALKGGYTHIIATLGKKQGSVNPKFARILEDFGFKKVELKNADGKPWISGGVRIEVTPESLTYSASSPKWVLISITPVRDTLMKASSINLPLSS